VRTFRNAIDVVTARIGLGGSPFNSLAAGRT
jgi:hypothetical protein